MLLSYAASPGRSACAKTVPNVAPSDQLINSTNAGNRSTKNPDDSVKPYRKCRFHHTHSGRVGPRVPSHTRTPWYRVTKYHGTEITLRDMIVSAYLPAGLGVAAITHSRITSTNCTAFDTAVSTRVFSRALRTGALATTPPLVLPVALAAEWASA